jgi:serine/threonine protein kinase
MRLLTHPKIVKLKAVYITKVKILTLLEYCEKGSLSSWINHRKYVT